jgi:hypothetical protein
MSLLTYPATQLPPSTPPSAEALIESCLAALAPDLSGRWQQAIALPGSNPASARFVMIDAASPLAKATAAAASGHILWLSTRPAHDALGSLDSHPDGAQWTCGPGTLIKHKGRSAWFALPTSLPCSLPHPHRLPWLACILAGHLLHLPPTAFQHWIIQHA